MNLDIDWLIDAFEEIEEPTIQDRIIAIGFLYAEVDAGLESIQAARKRLESLQGL